MENSLEWEPGKSLELDVDKRAWQALQKRDAPLYVILELYFSCLIRKRVLISDSPRQGINYLDAGNNLYIGFTPVMTRACSVADAEGAPPELTEFPIKRRSAYLPKWLRLEQSGGNYSGEFGYT